MNILIFGATGYLGSRVAQACVRHGYDVSGLVRNHARTPALPAQVKPLVGDLSQPEKIAALCTDFDTIINTGFPSHGKAWFESVALEKDLHRRLVETLSNTNKTLIVTNGTIFLGDSGEGRLTENAPIQPEHPAAIRADSTRIALNGAQQGIRVMELRLASFVYGEGGSIFLPRLMATARRTRRSIYVGDGQIGASTVHVNAAAKAFVQALKYGKAGEIYHIAGDEEPLVYQMANAIAIGAGNDCQAVSVSQAEAVESTDFFTTLFLTTNNRLNSTKARTELGWSGATDISLLWDVAHGSYANQSMF
ncbi:MAG: NAD-dependent epimerase/dehydratase family protein [Cyanobacteria bacterium P01_A01_bin.123]